MLLTVPKEELQLLKAKSHLWAERAKLSDTGSVCFQSRFPSVHEWLWFIGPSEPTAWPTLRRQIVGIPSKGSGEENRGVALIHRKRKDGTLKICHRGKCYICTLCIWSSTEDQLGCLVSVPEGQTAKQSVKTSGEFQCLLPLKPSGTLLLTFVSVRSSICGLGSWKPAVVSRHLGAKGVKTFTPHVNLHRDVFLTVTTGDTPGWTFRIPFRKLRALIRPQGIRFHLCYTLPFETITSWRWQTITWGVRWCPATLWPQSRVQCGTSSPSPKKLLSRWICPHQLSSPTSPCKSALFCLPADGLFLA